MRSQHKNHIDFPHYIKGDTLTLMWQNLTDHDVPDIIQFLTHHPEIDHINLNHNKIGAKGATYLAQHNPGVTRVTLAHNVLGAKGVINFAKYNQKVKVVDFSNNATRAHGAEGFAKYNKVATTVNFSSNEIGPGIIGFAKHNKVAEVVILQHNSIDDKGASHIAQNDKTAREIDLNHNPITDYGLFEFNKSMVIHIIHSNFMKHEFPENMQPPIEDFITAFMVKATEACPTNALVQENANAFSALVPTLLNCFTPDDFLKNRIKIRLLHDMERENLALETDQYRILLYWLKRRANKKQDLADAMSEFKPMIKWAMVQYPSLRPSFRELWSYLKKAQKHPGLNSEDLPLITALVLSMSAFIRSNNKAQGSPRCAAILGEFNRHLKETSKFKTLFSRTEKICWTILFVISCAVFATGFVTGSIFTGGIVFGLVALALAGQLVRKAYRNAQQKHIISEISKSKGVLFFQPKKRESESMDTRSSLSLTPAMG